MDKIIEQIERDVSHDRRWLKYVQILQTHDNNTNNLIYRAKYANNDLYLYSNSISFSKDNLEVFLNYLDTFPKLFEVEFFNMVVEYIPSKCKRIVLTNSTLKSVQNETECDFIKVKGSAHILCWPKNIIGIKLWKMLMKTNINWPSLPSTIEYIILDDIIRSEYYKLYPSSNFIKYFTDICCTIITNDCELALELLTANNYLSIEIPRNMVKIEEIQILSENADLIITKLDIHYKIKHKGGDILLKSASKK
jgi:hypothetical protein